MKKVQTVFATNWDAAINVSLAFMNQGKSVQIYLLTQSLMIVATGNDV